MPTNSKIVMILMVQFSIERNAINPNTLEVPITANCLRVRNPTILNSKLVTFCGTGCWSIRSNTQITIYITQRIKVELGGIFCHLGTRVHCKRLGGKSKGAIKES